MHCAAAADCCVTNLWGLDYPVWVAYLNWRILPPNTSTANDDDNDLTDGLSSVCTNIFYPNEL